MKYSFKAVCTKDQLKGIRAFVEETLLEQNFPEEDIHLIVLAVDEVCANLIIHAHNCNPSECIDLDILISPKKEVTFEIYDRGAGFNFSNYKEPKIEEIIKNKRKGGIGLMLVKKIMDKVEFEKKNKQNVCRMFKKIPTKPSSNGVH